MLREIAEEKGEHHRTMSDAAMKVDPDFYNRRLLDADANGLEQSRSALPRGGGGAGSMGGSAPIGMMRGGGGGG